MFACIDSTVKMKALMHKRSALFTIKIIEPCKELAGHGICLVPVRRTRPGFHPFRASVSATKRFNRGPLVGFFNLTSRPKTITMAPTVATPYSPQTRD